MQRLLWISWLPLYLALSLLSANAATVRGSLVKWHPLDIDFSGPHARETDSAPNPFLDFRLRVILTSPSGVKTTVPGFFAGDGQGNGQGNVWRARFSADEVGQWRYQGVLRAGDEVAVNTSDDAGSAYALEGSSGVFTIGQSLEQGPAFLRHGRLEYVGEHYLKFRDGPYWIKGGTDSPENLLGFAGIDGTYDHGGIDADFLHDFASHRSDFRDGDPLFSHSTTGVDSRGLIGALNYLGSLGVNSIYFLPMNLGGDGQETYPFVGASKTRYNKTHYDISKLYQWNLVLDHAQQQGIALNIVLSETEKANEQWLDDGQLGVERKLFFRELVARFGYLLAVKWNLGEENDFPRVELDKHADYIQSIDWSRKPIAVHTHINQFFRYGEIVGDSRYSASSIQYTHEFAGEFVEQWRNNSANAGHPWVLDMDENTNGLGPATVNQRRKQILYDVLFSGGNIEWYFGYNPQPVGGDVDAGDFRQRESMWQQMRYAREMMQNELPFWRMQPADWRVSGDSDAFGGAEVFVLEGESYAIYLPSSNGAEVLDMGNVSGQYQQRWFDPRSGQMTTSSQSISASNSLRLGSAPYSTREDWVVLITRIDQQIFEEVATTGSNDAPRFNNVPSPEVNIGERFAITLSATDTDGTFPSVTVGDIPAGMRIQGPGNGQLVLDWVVPESADSNSVVELIAIDALDSSLRTEQQMAITVLDTSQAQDSVTPGVAPPIFRNIDRQQTNAGALVSFRVQADDADGIPPSLIVLNAPEGSSFDDNGDGTRMFRWQTSTQNAGIYTLTFIASDHDRPEVTARQEVELVVQ